MSWKQNLKVKARVVEGKLVAYSVGRYHKQLFQLINSFNQLRTCLKWLFEIILAKKFSLSFSEGGEAGGVLWRMNQPLLEKSVNGPVSPRAFSLFSSGNMFCWKEENHSQKTNRRWSGVQAAVFRGLVKWGISVCSPESSFWNYNLLISLNL